MFNEEKAKKKIMLAYQQIRIVKMIQQGHRSAVGIAKKVNAPLNLVHYHLKSLTED